MFMLREYLLVIEPLDKTNRQLMTVDDCLQLLGFPRRSQCHIDVQEASMPRSTTIWIHLELHG